MYRLLILVWSSMNIAMLHHYFTIDSNFDIYEDSCEDSNPDHAHPQFNQCQTAKEVEKKISHPTSNDYIPDSNFDSYEDSNHDQIKTEKKVGRNVSNLISEHLTVDSNFDSHEDSNQDYLNDEFHKIKTEK